VSDKFQRVCAVQPVSREEQNGPRFHYVVRWRKRRHKNPSRGQHPTATAPLNVSDQQGAFHQRRVEANTSEMTVGGRRAFEAYEVYVMSANDIGPAVTTPQLVTAYTGEDGTQTSSE